MNKLLNNFYIRSIIRAIKESGYYYFSDKDKIEIINRLKYSIDVLDDYPDKLILSIMGMFESFNHFFIVHNKYIDLIEKKYINDIFKYSQFKRKKKSNRRIKQLETLKLKIVQHEVKEYLLKLNGIKINTNVFYETK